jgi:hypothetical protein
MGWLTQPAVGLVGLRQLMSSPYEGNFYLQIIENVKLKADPLLACYFAKSAILEIEIKARFQSGLFIL